MRPETGPRPATAGFFALVVDRPVAVLMVFVALAVFGLVSYAQLPLNLMPDLSYPTLTVRTEFPGAAPEEVENQVTRRVEEAVATTGGLISLESRSRAEQSDVVLEFDWGTDMDQAAQSVRERLQTTFLPDEAGRPLVLRYDPSLDPILRVALSSGPGFPEQDPERALLLLRDLAEQTIKPALEAMDGVAAVRLHGGLEREVLVEVREDWLAARGVTVEQLRTALAAANVNLAGGSIREGDTEYLIRTLNEFGSLDDIRDIEVVRADGVRVPLRDLATVREATREREVIAHLDGREAVEMEIHKEADANIVAVARAVKERLGVAPAAPAGMAAAMAMGPSSLRDRLPEGAVLRVIDDQAAFIEAAVANLRSTAVLGGLLAVAVLFLFLRDLRATAIIGVAIPVSVLVAFAALYLAGVSLNLMSLGGLALGVGMLVDNAVVVLEAIQVHRERGVARREAAVRGVSEVAAAVSASTFTTVAVFLPIVFVEGIAGQLFRDLALAVVCSLLGSLLVALVFVPMLAARAVRLPERRPPLRDVSIAFRFGAFRQLREAWRWDLERRRRLLLLPWQVARFLLRLGLELAGVLVLGPGLFLARLGAWLAWRVLPRLHRLALGAASLFQRGYGRLAARYEGWLDNALRHGGRVLLAALVLLGLGLAGAARLGTELIPQVHQGRFTVRAALPVGTPLDRTVARLQEVEQRIGRHPEVEAVHATFGAERRADTPADEGEHTARFLVQLAPGGDLAARQEAAMEAIRHDLADLEDVEVRLETPALFSFRTPVEVHLYGDDLDLLRRVAGQAREALAALPGLKDVRSSLVAGYPEIRIRYDRRLLERYGLDTASVARAVRDKVQGAVATRMRRGDQRIDLLVRLTEPDRATVDDLARLNVNPALRPPIPLSAVAQLEEGVGPSEIRRIDQRRAAVITANLSGLDLGATARSIRERLDRMPWSAEVAHEVAGQSREMQRSMGSLAFALGLAVFLVYAIMASTFESLLHPFVILFSLPLAVVGVTAVLAPFGTPLSVVVLIGVIVLAGVVVNNAIVLVDTVNRLRAAGQPRDAALRQAGRLRLRPILITTATTVLGLLPLALGWGEGAEIQKPLARTLIGGLTSSTLLTLLVIPVVYQRIERLLGRSDPAGDPPAGGAG